LICFPLNENHYHYYGYPLTKISLSNYIPPWRLWSVILFGYSVNCLSVSYLMDEIWLADDWLTERRILEDFLLRKVP
jgi:hypothetical protein